MTTRVTVKNENAEGMPAIEVDYIDPNDAASRSMQGPRILLPQASAEFWVHSSQSLTVREAGNES